MTGTENKVQFANGYRLEASATQEIQIMQKTATDVSCINNAGNPEGVIAANPASICHDRTNGDIYEKKTGTGTTGWLKLQAGTPTDLHVAKFIVNAAGTSAGANYTSISNALTNAVSGDTIFVMPGTYTEDLTLKAGVNICAFTCDAQANGATPNVRIIGKATANFAGNATYSGLCFQTNSDFCLVVSGSSQMRLFFIDCFIYAINNTAISITNNSGSAGKVFFYQCRGDLGTTGIAYFAHSGTPGLRLFKCDFDNNAGSSTNSTTSGTGGVNFQYTLFNNGITSSSTSSLELGRCIIGKPLTYNGTGTATLADTSVIGGASTAVTVGPGVTLNCYRCSISSSNTNAIDGTGTINYGSIAFISSSSKINVTTQVPFVNSNDAINVVTPAAYPYTTTAQDGLIKVDTSSARTITPLASPATGQRHIIKDTVGSAAANNITITPSGKNIDGAASSTLNVAYGSVTIVYTGSEWSII